MDKSVSNLTRATLVTLATLRATRFVTSDKLGDWTILQPAQEWADRYEEAALRREWEAMIPPRPPYEQWVPTDTRPRTWQAKLVSGLTCPFCVGFWIGALILLGEWATRRRGLRWARGLWTAALTVLALNEVVGHISSRIDG